MTYTFYDAVRNVYGEAETDDKGRCTFTHNGQECNMPFYDFLVYAARNKLRIKYGQMLGQDGPTA